AGGRRHRVGKVAGQVLTSDSVVPPDEIQDLTEYLYRKKLCVIRSAAPGAADGDSGAGTEEDVRYPGLIIEKINGSEFRLTDGRAPLRAATVWWQDRCLASPEVTSKVGAVTVSAKSGSKTGLSHVIDWAEAAGLISSTAQATPEAQLLAKLDGKCRA